MSTVMAIAGAAHKLGWKVDGESSAELEFSFKDLTDSVAPNIISVKGSGDLAEPTVGFGITGSLTFTIYNVPLQIKLNSGENGMLGTLVIKEITAATVSGTTVTETTSAYKTYHGRMVVNSEAFSISDGRTMSCTFTPDVVPSHLTQTASMYELTN